MMEYEKASMKIIFFESSAVFTTISASDNNKSGGDSGSFSEWT